MRIIVITQELCRNICRENVFKIKKAKGKQIDYNVVSNLILLTDEMIDFSLKTMFLYVLQ